MKQIHAKESTLAHLCILLAPSLVSALGKALLGTAGGRAHTDVCSYALAPFGAFPIPLALEPALPLSQKDLL